MDTIVRFEHGIKRYIFSAIDVKSRFAFAYTYKTGSSLSASDFVQKLDRVSPFPIKAVQTDNGSEFLGQADRSHYSLKNKAPLRLISDKINEVNSSSEESNMYWTHTSP